MPSLQLECFANRRQHMVTITVTIMVTIMVNIVVNIMRMPLNSHGLLIIGAGQCRGPQGNPSYHALGQVEKLTVTAGVAIAFLKFSLCSRSSICKQCGYLHKPRSQNQVCEAVSAATHQNVLWALTCAVHVNEQPSTTARMTLRYTNCVRKTC